MRQAIILTLTVLLISCDSQHILLKGNQNKLKEYEIGKYNSGCCGCVALYYSLFDGKQLSKQMIFEMYCGLWQPTVFSFTKDSEGNVNDVQKYIAVSDSTATFTFTNTEKLLLSKLDSVVTANKIQHKDFKFSNLTGYREKSSQEEFHVFWIDEKGKSRMGFNSKK